MYPGFHRSYAERLAWRVRLLLAHLLLPLVLVHPLWILLSLASFLLPGRLFERKALQEIAQRYGLAYQTALEYGEDPLWEAARKTKAQLPPFPWGRLGLYLALLLAALLFLLTPRTPPFFPLEPPSIPQVDPGKSQPRPSENPQAGSSKSESEGIPSPSPSKEGSGVPNPSPEPSPGQDKGFSPEPLETPGVPQAPGEQPGSAPGVPSPQGIPGRTEPIPPLQIPQGEEVVLPLGQAETGEGPPSLPSPWPEGPPKEVKRSAEVYLQKTEPPPEVRELVRRYFAP